MANIDVPQDELSAAIAARMELGKAYERDLAESFVERIERSIDARVDAKVAEQVPDRRQRSGGGGASAVFGQVTQFVLGVVSVCVGIPITNFAHNTSETFVACAGLVGINAANALRGRVHR
jgi:hypothetical protein